MAMTHKQRILAAARKQPVDKLPFGARIDLWYNYHSGHDTLPEKYRGWSIVDILRDQGAGIQLRNVRLWETEYHKVEVVTHSDPPYTTTEYRTPVGTVTEKTAYTPEEGSLSPYKVELRSKVRRITRLLSISWRILRLCLTSLTTIKQNRCWVMME